MKARGYRVEHMREADVPQVVALEDRSFPTPWSARSFLHELRNNPFAHCHVVRAGGPAVVGYACVWRVDRQLLINTIAIAEEHRGRGVGRWFLEELLERARKGGCEEALLEVRPSNRPALRLYRRLGFLQLAVRRGYYSDGEDALLMRKELGPPGRRS